MPTSKGRISAALVHCCTGSAVCCVLRVASFTLHAAHQRRRATADLAEPNLYLAAVTLSLLRRVALGQGSTAELLRPFYEVIGKLVFLQEPTPESPTGKPFFALFR